MKTKTNSCGDANLCLFLNSLVDYVVILDNLFLDGIRQILHTRFLLLQVDVAQSTVEQDLAGIQLEEETQLGIIDHVVASQVQEGVVEVGEGLLKVANEKVGYTLLEIGYGEVLV